MFLGRAKNIFTPANINSIVILLRVGGRFELTRVKLQHMNEAVQGNLILLFKASKSTIKATWKGV